MNGRFMAVCCKLFAPAFITLAVSLISATAGPESSVESKRIVHPLRPIPGLAPDPAMCCSKDARRWMTTLQACRRAGGRPLPESACRAGRRVCCRRGSGYFWATARSCSGNGRTVVATDVCSAPGKRVCCSRPRRYPRLFIDTRRACDRAGGQAVEPRLCRTRPDPRRQPACCLTPDGNFLLTRAECRAARGRLTAAGRCRDPICCERDGRVSLSRRAQCRQDGGRLVSRNRCRARGGTVRPR